RIAAEAASYDEAITQKPPKKSAPPARLTQEGHSCPCPLLGAMLFCTLTNNASRLKPLPTTPLGHPDRNPNATPRPLPVLKTQTCALSSTAFEIGSPHVPLESRLDPSFD